MAAASARGRRPPRPEAGGRLGQPGPPAPPYLPKLVVAAVAAAARVILLEAREQREVQARAECAAAQLLAVLELTMSGIEVAFWQGQPPPTQALANLTLQED